MAKGDIHVEQKRGAWQVEAEGFSPTTRELVEQLATRDQAWRVAVYYAQTSSVDVFLHERGDIKEEKRFREQRGRPQRRRR